MPLDIGCIDPHARTAQFVQCQAHGARVPHDGRIEHHAERAHLICLACVIRRAQLAAAPAEHGAGQTMPTFASVDLDQWATPVQRVIDACPGFVPGSRPGWNACGACQIEQVEGLADASVRMQLNDAAEAEEALAEAARLACQQHPDSTILASLPGPGELPAARVLAEMGDDRTRLNGRRPYTLV